VRALHRPPRPFRGPPYRALVIVLVLVFLFLLRYWRNGDEVSSPASPLAAGLHRVVRVVDGDTLIVAPHHIVRLIGVDTPETVKPEHAVERFGPEATAFTRKFLAGGTAELSFDRERVDQYGRFLAYVWVGDRLLNEDLIRYGLGRFEPQFRYSYEMKRRFEKAQREAQAAGVGIWSEDPGEEDGDEGDAKEPAEAALQR
jgi:endonuclease YncB( thermonuclease family)